MPLTTNVQVRYKPGIILSKSNNIDCIKTTATLSVVGGSTYLWSPAAFLNDSTSSHPIAYPETTTTFKLKVLSVDGCEHDSSITVVVNKSELENGYRIPTAFAPGNGVNSCFGVKHWGYVKHIEFAIYNRYGQRVFYTTNLNDCWDGTINGKPQDTGTFVYKIKANTLCGEVIRNGTLVLLR